MKNKITGPQYWRSLDELAQNPGFKDWVEREFPQGASEIEGVNRRHFMKIMTASFAFAGLGMSGCRRPEKYILPYSKQPENMIPGEPKAYASSLPGFHENIPIVVETHQARPTKIEGNGLYDPYGGGTDIFSQASVLDLYDPDRSTRSLHLGKPIDQTRINDLLSGIYKKYQPTGGQGLAILAESSTSPTRQRIVEGFRKRLPRALWYEYDPVHGLTAEAALERLFGKPLRPQVHFAKASRILSFESDFLHKEPGHLGNARGFAQARRVHKADEARQMNRLYQVESLFSVTGGMADHRLRLPSSQITAFAVHVAAEVLDQIGIEKAFAAQLRSKATGLDFDHSWIKACVADLLENSGKSVVLAGCHQPEIVHQVVYLINEIIGAHGRTVDYLEVDANPANPIDELTQRIDEGRIDSLVIIGGNPVYNAPVDLELGQKLKSGKINEVIRYGYYEDETSALAQYHIAATHPLESWGDGRTFDGTLVSVQPMILPLFDGMMDIEFVARLAGFENPEPYSLVLDTFRNLAEGDHSKKVFERFLHDGIYENTRFKATHPKSSMGLLKSRIGRTGISSSPTSREKLEICLRPDNSVWDGRYNNNGWLQECPDPLSKLTWDNAIQISPKLAEDIGFNTKSGTFLIGGVARNTAEIESGRETAPEARLTLNGTTVLGPVHIQPGLADYSVLLPLGYGRSKTGRVGTGTGFDVYPLLKSKTGLTSVGAKLELTGNSLLLANTQEHWSMEGRAIVREANAEDYEKHPDFAVGMGMESHTPAVYGESDSSSLQEKAAKQPRGASLYETPTFGGAQQWGMNIDLNTCTGCNSCVVACQSENNIPIVGKEQVMRGREMHWMRLDRYYSSGDLDENMTSIPHDPQVSVMPMLCQQCEMAPCEQVCPVNATVHDDQGLNVMAYNRCVGTRYCANNCPYKVRRFNFFDWNKRELNRFYEGPLGPSGMPELHQMQKNPDVTVRMRGVMEKCTYCQQRIEQAKIAQKSKARDTGNIEVPDGTIKTACQQVCPTDAITFGDILDAGSEVSRTKSSDRDYAVLGYLNVRPRTTYLARLRNPNPEMPDFHSMPLSRKEYENTFGHGNHEAGGEGH